MSKRLDVLTAVKALIAAALPDARVLGLDGEDAAPRTVPPLGMVVVRAGDPGEPIETTFSPLTYWYDHRIPVEVSAQQGGTRSSEQRLDDMLVPIGAAVEADRTLGGLCDWLETTSAGTEDIYPDGGGRPPRGGDFMIIASYSTTNPLA